MGDGQGQFSIYVYLIIQGSIKLFPADHLARSGFLFRYKKAVMPKKKVFAARNHKDCLPSLHSKEEKQKRKSFFFIARQFYASRNYKMR
jgi:hypothetical protein